MNKRHLLTASMILLACACEPKKPEVKTEERPRVEEVKPQEQAQPSQGCKRRCEVEKPQETLKSTEQKAEQVAAPVLKKSVETPKEAVSSLPKSEEKPL